MLYKLTVSVHTKTGTRLSKVASGVIGYLVSVARGFYLAVSHLGKNPPPATSTSVHFF